MIEKMKITAKTVEEAIKKAADIWKIDAVKNGYTVIQEPSRGIFGIGSKDAIIEVNKNVPDILFEEPKKEEQPAPVKEAVKEEPTKITPAPSESVPTPQEEETQIIVEDLSAASVQETTLAQAAAEVQTLPEDASAEEVGLAFLGPIFKALQVEDAIVNVSEDAGTIRFDVTGEHVGILIGRHGETLNAIQFLMSLVINGKVENHRGVIFDVRKLSRTPGRQARKPRPAHGRKMPPHPSPRHIEPNERR